MNQDHHITSEIASRNKVYSAPRRFDLATLFVVMIVYACLLGVFVGLGLPDPITFLILGFITLVAIGQPVLFGGRMPRLASVIVGGVSLPVIFAMMAFNDGANVTTIGMIISGVSCMAMGASVGYLAGALVGGVFLIADIVRRGRGVVD